jgi:pyruvate formate lyase activating enzyme
MEVTPEKVVEMTKQYRCQGLAYTYSQPTIFMEFAHDIGVQARKEGLVNIFVSNGYDTPETVGLMRDFLDCITVDFKGNGETSFVRKYIGIANAEPIFDTLLGIRKSGQKVSVPTIYSMRAVVNHGVLSFANTCDTPI